MEVRTLASGSSGNCLLVSCEKGHILVDCGVSCRRVSAALAQWGLTPADLSGVLVTHEHTDHVSGLATLTNRWALPVYTSPGTAWRLSGRVVAEQLLRPIAPGDSFEAGPFGVDTFHTSHDAAEPMGFALTCQGRRAAVVTDLGYVSTAVLRGVLGSDLVVCEANHDVEWLKTGPYPYYLKTRILGDRGHLSNEAGGDLARQCVEAGARTVILAHLSNQNNTPQHARAAVEAVLRDGGIDPDRDVTLAVAPRSEISQAFEV